MPCIVVASFPDQGGAASERSALAMDSTPSALLAGGTGTAAPPVIVGCHCIGNQMNQNFESVEETAVEIQATPIEVSEIAREERMVCICQTDFN
jgi:hypothetical protein